MGWRLWDAYEDEAEERWRELPWRDRYPLGRLILLAVIVGFLIAVFSGVAPARSGPINSSDIRVLDGDTIRIGGQRPDVRLIGFNTPETRRAKCPEETKLGAKATRRLREIVRAGNLDFQFVECSCKPGTQGTDACNFGRRCGVLKADGRDVGDILIEEGLAAPFHCGPKGCPKMPRPWCD